SRRSARWEGAGERSSPFSLTEHERKCHEAPEENLLPAEPGEGIAYAHARLVFEALADITHCALGHELSAGIEVGGGNPAIDLQIELHDWPEALEEGLLPERSGECAGLDPFELLGSKIVAIGADLVF